MSPRETAAKNALAAAAGPAPSGGRAQPASASAQKQQEPAAGKESRRTSPANLQKPAGRLEFT